LPCFRTTKVSATFAGSTVGCRFGADHNAKAAKTKVE
jgi:hypothetical protein